MLKKLHKLVIKSYIGPLVMTFFIAEFVLIMQFLWLYIGDLVGKGLEWYIIAELLLYASARLAQMALPLAILLASIMTFGNMGEHFELSAMKSAGISLQKIMKPLIIFSIIISIGSFFFANYVIPYTNLKMGSLLYDITKKRPEMNMKPGVFSNDIPNFSIKIKDKNRTNNMMYDFMIYDHRSYRGNVKVTLADSGFMEITADQKYMIITLFGGSSYEEMKDNEPAKKNYPESRAYFDKQVSVFELEGLDMKRTNEDLFRHSHRMKGIFKLQKDKDSLSQVFDKKTERYIANLKRNNYFKYEIKYNKELDSIKYISDSIQNLKLPDSLRVIADIDSIFNAMNEREKERTMQIALENAKSTQQYVSTTQEDFYGRKKKINKHDIAWHEKFTLAFACLIFFFIGAPLGAIIRKGGFGLPFLVSITFFIFYYVISLMGRKFVEENVLISWQGMWMSSLLTLPLGILFTYKATTDSVLFDIGAYVEFLKRPFKVFQIQFRDPDVVFHKDIQLVSDAELLNEIQNIRDKSRLQQRAISKILRSRKKIYRLHFKQENADYLRKYIDEYNHLYSMLAVRFREQKLLSVSLSKFPRMSFEEYQLTDFKRKSNRVVMTIGFFPLGLLVMMRSRIKLKVLKQKIDIIEKEVVTFEQYI